jgi:hypothetical protein
MVRLLAKEVRSGGGVWKGVDHLFDSPGWISLSTDD